MKWRLERFEIPGRFPRQSILLHLEERSVGEIAPLPGFSKEDLEAAEKQLRAHFASPLPFLFPSVHFGLYSALLDLEDPLPPFDCPTYALLMGANILRDADRAYEKGFKVAKLKLGDKSDEEAHALIAALRNRFALRLDLNRRWTLKRALNFFSSYENEAFDYIEEPLQDPRELIHFSHPFALDETLREPLGSSLVKHPNCAALILKPTLLGDISPYLKMHHRCILSSSFEGPVGVGQIAKLVKRHQLQNELHGLDTLSH